MPRTCSGTAYAAQDLRAVLRRLGLRRVDLYGDSYGSWFALAFAARFPHVLRSVILDSTYAIRNLDPYYASSGSSGRAALDRVCARDPGCTAATGGRSSAVARLGALLAWVRRGALRGPHASAITARHLVDLFQNSGSDPLILRDLDASVRAALAGDTAPMLRLIAEGAGNGSYPDPGYFSDGAYMAVGCTDYPQLFSLHAASAVRSRQLRSSEAHAPAGVFAPFTAREWFTMSGYSETYDACLDWPRPCTAPRSCRSTTRRSPPRCRCWSSVVTSTTSRRSPTPSASHRASAPGSGSSTCTTPST